MFLFFTDMKIVQDSALEISFLNQAKLNVFRLFHSS